MRRSFPTDGAGRSLLATDPRLLSAVRTRENEFPASPGMARYYRTGVRRVNRQGDRQGEILNPLMFTNTHDPQASLQSLMGSSG